MEQIWQSLPVHGVAHSGKAKRTLVFRFQQVCRRCARHLRQSTAPLTFEVALMCRVDAATLAKRALAHFASRLAFETDPRPARLAERLLEVYGVVHADSAVLALAI